MQELSTGEWYPLKRKENGASTPRCLFPEAPSSDEGSSFSSEHSLVSLPREYLLPMETRGVQTQTSRRRRTATNNGSFESRGRDVSKSKSPPVSLDELWRRLRAVSLENAAEHGKMSKSRRKQKSGPVADVDFARSQRHRQKPPLQPLTLQEALLFHKPSFPERVRARQAAVQRRKQERKEISCAAAAAAAKPVVVAKPKNKDILRTKIPSFVTVEKKSAKKPITRQEAIQHSKKIYEGLHEVQAKKQREKRQAACVTNRIKAMIYGKKTREKLKKLANRH